jgi:PST family polysaccharide transporter
VIGLFPFVAVNYLVNALFTAQGAALAASGHSWVVMRTSAINMVLIFAAALLFVPHLGLTGYAISETVGVAAQYANHRATKRMLGRSADYRGALPWVVLLVPPLFAPATHLPWSVILVAVPLAILAVPGPRREVIRQVKMVTEGTRVTDLLRRRGGKGGKGAGTPPTAPATTGTGALT